MSCLLRRIEAVLKKLQTKIPVISEAEKDMHKELKKMEESLKHYKNAIQQVRLIFQVKSRSLTRTEVAFFSQLLTSLRVVFR